MAEIKKTALYDVHKNAGAKMVEFAGYWMPVQYRGIMEEHRKVRNSVGIFDVSHMGEFFISGPRAAEYLQKMTLNDVSKLQTDKAQYTGMCFEDGGMVDDLIVYCLGDHFMTIVNAANREKDYKWMMKNIEEGAKLDDRSDDYSLFAVQGRNAQATLQKLTDVDLAEIKPFWLRQGNLADCDTFIARTGYTGEDGFEIAVHAPNSERVWSAILDAGKEFDIEPIGLAARDTLRLEARLCLYGNDIDETTNPLEAGLGWIVKFDKGDFLGKEALLKVKESGMSRKLVGFELRERAMARHGYKIVKDGAEIGHVTSGTFSPTLEKGIGLGYVNLPHSEVGTEIGILVRGKEVKAEVVKTPFYKRPY